MTWLTLNSGASLVLVPLKFWNLQGGSVTKAPQDSSHIHSSLQWPHSHSDPHPVSVTEAPDEYILPNISDAALPLQPVHPHDWFERATQSLPRFITCATQ